MAHPKGVLIERLQQHGQQPRFDTRSEGPDHEPTFESDVCVGEDVLGHGSGSTKRVAERRAAEAALERLDSGDDAQAPRENRGGKRGGKRGGAREAPPSDAPATATAEEAQPVAEAAAEDTPFEGPWPLFERVLAASLEVADHRVDAALRGPEAREAVRGFALQLYKDVLEDLGEVVEVEEEESVAA